MILLRYYNIILFSFIPIVFSACQSSNQTVSLFPDSISLESWKNTEERNKALVFYASDDPVLLPYFSTSFTRRLTEAGVFKALQNRNLNKQWMARSSLAEEDLIVEDRIRQYANVIKEYYLEGKNKKKLRYMAQSAIKETYKLLANNPSSVGLSYAELSFWCALSLLDLPHQARPIALIYEKYATFALKDNLETQIENDTVKKLKKLTKPYLVKQKNIQIKNSRGCVIFVDGQEIKTKYFFLPPKTKSVISATCLHGSFSQVFLSDTYDKLVIAPNFPTSFYSMPSIEGLPKDQIQSEKVAVVILVYWSHQKKYMDSIVVDPKDFSIVKKTRISVATQRELDKAGDNLLEFIISAKNQLFFE